MTTQYTSILKLALPVQGELSGTWGDVVNDNITSMVEEAVAGRAVINTWTTNSHTLTTADGTTAESRCAMLEFTDTGTALTGAATVVCPSLSKLYVCKNDSGQQVTIKTSAGTGVAIPDGQTMFVFCDGTNVEQCTTNFNSLSFNDYTLSFGGAVTTAGAFTTSGAYALTLTTTGATNVTLPTTGTLATLDGTETLTNKTLTAPTISSPTLTGSISATDLTISGDTTIGDAAADGLTVNATITSNLIFTDNTYDIGASGATRPRNLFLAGNATIGGTVTLSGGIDVTGALGVDGDFDVNTDKFTVASATGNTAVAGTLGVTGATTATGGLNVDTISEITAAGGVTIDSVVLKDGGATLTDDLIVDTDTLFVDASADKVMFGTTYNADGGNVTIRGTYGANNASDYRGNNALALTGEDPGTAAAGSGVNLAFVPISNRGATAVISGENANTNKEGGTQLRFSAGAGAFPTTQRELLLLNYDSGAIFNEGSADIDFRVESDTNTHALFVDAGNSRVGINSSTPAAPLHVAGVDGTSVRMITTNADAGGNNFMDFYNSVGRMGYLGYASGSADIFYVWNEQNSNILAGTNNVEHMRFHPTNGTVFNEGGEDQDFRVESDSEEHMIFVDAGNNKVGIAQDSPTAKLHVNSQDVGSVTNLIVSQLGNTSSTSFVAQEFKFNEGGVPGVKLMAGKNASAGADFYLYTGQAANGAYIQRMSITGGGTTTGSVVFNEDSYDQDFRVESNSNTHALFVDAGSSLTYVGASSTTTAPSAGGLGVKAGGEKTVVLESTSADTLLLFRDSGTTTPPYLGSFGDDLAIGGYGGSAPNVGIGTTSPGALLDVSGGDARVINTGGGVVAKSRVSTDNQTDAIVSARTTDANGTRTGFMANAYPDASYAETMGRDDTDFSAIGWLYYTLNSTYENQTNANLKTETTAGTEFSLIRASAYAGIAINEDSGSDIDFRVESDNQTHIFFVDAGNDRIGIFESAPSYPVHIKGQVGMENGSNKDFPAVTPTGFGYSQSTYGVVQLGKYVSGSASGAATVSIGYDPSSNTNGSFTGYGQEMLFANGMNLVTPDSGDTLWLYQMRMLDQGVVFNENSRGDLDFRIESDTNTHALFVDAGSNRVHIGGTTVPPSGTWSGVVENKFGVAVQGSPVDPSSSDILSSARFSVGGDGGNYLTMGTYTNSTATGTAWIQSSYYVPSTAVYDLVLNPLGGNVGIGDVPNPATQLHIENAGVQTVLAVRDDATVGSELGYVTIGSGSSYTAGMKAEVRSGQPGIDRVDLVFGTTTYTTSLQTMRERLRLKDAVEAVVNDLSDDYNFRVESNNNSNMLLVDAGVDKVGIGVNPQDNTNGGLHVGSPQGFSVGDGNTSCYHVFAAHQGNIPSSTTSNVMTFEGPAFARYVKVTVSGYLCQQEGYFKGYQSWDGQTGGAVNDYVNITFTTTLGSNSGASKAQVRLTVTSTSGTSGYPVYRMDIITGTLSGQLYDCSVVVEFFNPPYYPQVV